MKSPIKATLAMALAGLALPALCAEADAFLKELSRTDGNANGEFFMPEAPQGPAIVTKADKAFEAEMMRTDGYVAEAPAPEQEPRVDTAQR